MSAQQTEEKSFWFQEAAFDVLQKDMAPGKNFPRALIAYRALCALASDSEAEVGPDRDGKPFQARLARLAIMAHQPWGRVAKLLEDFLRLGMIDPVKVPSDAMEYFTLRLRTLDDPKADCQEGEPT